MSATVKSLMEMAYMAVGDKRELSESVKARVLEQMSSRTLIEGELDVMTIPEMKSRRQFYYYHQARPRGDNYSFFTPDVSNTTIIEARSVEEANAKAERFGIRFGDGVDRYEQWSDEWMQDDSNRWVRATNETVIDALAVRECIDTTFIHFMDGTMKRYGKCRPAGSHDYYDFWDGYNHDFTCLPEISGLSLIDEQDYERIAHECYEGKIPPQYLQTN